MNKKLYDYHKDQNNVFIYSDKETFFSDIWSILLKKFESETNTHKNIFGLFNKEKKISEPLYLGMGLLKNDDKNKRSPQDLLKKLLFEKEAANDDNFSFKKAS